MSTRLYTTISGTFLLLQGSSTLAFRLFPALDRAFPTLLATTMMMPPHSLLHILTGLLALATLRWQRTDWFALGFGLFYVGLAAFGTLTHQSTLFHLQPFDHPFHFLLGGLGLLAYAWTMKKRS